MIYKYYTSDLMTLNKDELFTPSMTVKVYRWSSPSDVVIMMKNQLKKDNLENHKLFNLRRIK